MIITKTPVRLEFLGGCTDVAHFYDLYPGYVLNSTINKYIYLLVNPTFNKEINVRYFQNETAKTVREIEHTRVKAALKHFKVRNGLEIVSVADIPSGGTGLGSSSSFTVGLIQSLYTLMRKKCNWRKLAELACHIEINVLKEPVGKQDQYAASHGGLNLMTFRKGGKVTVRPLKLSNNTLTSLHNHLLFIYTGTTRSAVSILKEQKRNLNRNIPYLKQMASLAKEGATELEEGNLKKFAQILEEEWTTKKNTAPITNPSIEKMYQKALMAGAWGGRVSGAGGGGFLTIIAPPLKHSAIKKAFKNHIFFTPELTNAGSKIIYKNLTYNPGQFT